MNMKKRILTLCSALLLSATSSAWAAPKVIVGSADFPESQLLLSLIHISEPTRPY